MRSSDVSRSVPRPSLALATRYLRWMLGFAPQAGASITALWPGPWSPVDPPGIWRRRRRDLPGSWGTPVHACPALRPRWG